jgi:hypothetical protein
MNILASLCLDTSDHHQEATQDHFRTTFLKNKNKIYSAHKNY